MLAASSGKAVDRNVAVHSGVGPSRVIENTLIFESREENGAIYQKSKGMLRIRTQ
jgi:hypothetical protein